MGTLRPGGDPTALAPETVRCADCRRLLDEDEAQAVRWGYWSDGLGDLYPFCEDCARRRFASDAIRRSPEPSLSGERATLGAKR